MQQNGSYIDQVNPNLQEQAEELMNSLFSEVEQTLSIDSDPNGDNSSGNLVKHSHHNFRQPDPLESPEPNSNWANTSAITKVHRDPTQITKTQIVKQPQSDRKVNLPKTKPPLKVSPPKSEAIGFIDSLLLGSAFTSAIFAVVLGLINTKITTPNPQSQLPIQLPVDNSALDSAAAEKLRRSLLEIPEPPTENVAVSKKLAPNSTAVIDIPQVKPIYIPIYQPPSTPANTVNNPIVTAPSPAPVAPVSSKKPVLKGSYTLIGVLDLGDRSSAMFDINGSIQSIKLGSVVGDSGWKVSRIAQQEVILKKGNEDNTVTVGQKF